MSEKIKKGGREPISAKFIADMGFSEDMDINPLKLDPQMKKALDDMGLAYRWINHKQYLQNGNFHRSGWKALPADSLPSSGGSLDFVYGRSPEGYIQRMDLVLAVKPKELQEKWRAKIRDRANAQNKAVSAKTVAAELKESARDHGIKDFKALEGYDEQDGE